MAHQFLVGNYAPFCWQFFVDFKNRTGSLCFLACCGFKTLVESNFLRSALNSALLASNRVIFHNLFQLLTSSFTAHLQQNKFVNVYIMCTAVVAVAFDLQFAENFPE